MKKERLQVRVRVNLLGTKEELIELLEGEYSKFSEIISRGDVEFDSDIAEVDPYIPEESAYAFCEDHDVDIEFGNTVG